METDLAHAHDCTPPPGNQGVIGAGGINIFFHFGFFLALRELGIDLASMVCASAGTQAAFFLANGYSIEETIEIFLTELRTARWNPLNWMRCFNPLADWLSISIGGWFSLKPYVAELVRKYHLKHSPKLRILTCDFLTGEAVLFEGEDYDLVSVVTASCSPKGWVQPVWYNHKGRLRLLVDGAHYHYNPTEFTCGTAIVSRFRSATEMPEEWATWLDLYFQMRELIFPLAGNQRYVDEDHNVVVTNGRPNIGGLNLGVSEATCRQMVEDGYNVAMPILKQALADGRIKSNKTTVH